MENACHALVPPAGAVHQLRVALKATPRSRLATLPTPVTRMRSGTGRELLIKRDDLIGPGFGGNKVRKLEFLTGDATQSGADCLVTVGAAQSNHARLTAAAGAVLGLETHLVLGGKGARPREGNQLLAELFGATLHFPGTDDWDELERAQDELADALRLAGRNPYTMPIGGSTAIGALGFVNAFDELMQQCAGQGWTPSAIVHATSSGGTHAGLLAGRAAYLADGLPAPRIVAVSVAKQPGDLAETATGLARDALTRLGLTTVGLDDSDVAVDGRWRGPDYAVPTDQADRAIRIAATSSAIILDRVYTAKAFAAFLQLDADTQPDASLLFWHTGGQPAVFAQGGLPPMTSTDASGPSASA